MKGRNYIMIRSEIALSVRLPSALPSRALAKRAETCQAGIWERNNGERPPYGPPASDESDATREIEINEFFNDTRKAKNWMFVFRFVSRLLLYEFTGGYDRAECRLLKILISRYHFYLLYLDISAFVFRCNRFREFSESFYWRGS